MKKKLQTTKENKETKTAKESKKKNTKRIGKRSGAWLIRYALEQLPIAYTFGIPGVHVTELYDELERSQKITPILVTHELGAAFMADAISRTCEQIGTLAIVPGPGLTHALSGIGEAFLGGIPMLIISGGIRTDIPNRYQLHEIDQIQLLKAITKKAVKVTEHKNIVPEIFSAYKAAIEGEPGPVFVEVPVDIQLFKGEVGEVPLVPSISQFKKADKNTINKAVAEIVSAKQIGIFAGWGARDANLVELAELLSAPVSVTLQGLSVFPYEHPLHVGMGFTKAAVPAAENAFKKVDCLIAIGTRFAEIPTGSFSAKVPEKLIHIDINKEVFDKNYPSTVAIEGDAKQVVEQLISDLKNKIKPNAQKTSALQKQIATDKKNYIDDFRSHKKKIKNKINPAEFFIGLRKNLLDDAIVVSDDGNHTFLTAELFANKKAKHFISPTDYNSMGYCVPAAIGAKLVHREKQVVGIVGDGAFLMTAMEIVTATTHGLGVVYFVFHDGELSQISQGQELPYNKKSCTILGEIKLDGIAHATGAHYLLMKKNSEIEKITKEALKISQTGLPVIVDVRIDYSKRTRFTAGIVQAVLSRFAMVDRFRFVGRAILRKVTSRKK